MRANQAHYPVKAMCRVLGLSPSGFYSWRDRGRSPRARRDQELLERIRRIHAESFGTYGAPRIHAELAEQGVRIGRKRVARLMEQAGLQGVTRRKFVVTTKRDRGARPAPDLVNRKFVARGPDRLWVADITYVPTWAGFLYLSIVLDVFSRRIVGWAMAAHLRTELVLQALEMAIQARSPQRVIHHSDQGTQFTSLEFGRRCAQLNVRPSMGSVGDAYDNAMAESFFATLECELIDRSRFKTTGEAQAAAFMFVEGWYNIRRRHSALGYVSPAEFERRYYERKRAA